MTQPVQPEYVIDLGHGGWHRIKNRWVRICPQFPPTRKLMVIDVVDSRKKPFNSPACVGNIDRILSAHWLIIGHSFEAKITPRHVGWITVRW